MRLPAKPPSVPPPNTSAARELLAKAATLAAEGGTLLSEGRYLHWDQLRHRTPPRGYNHLEWWMATKLARRAAGRLIPPVDVSGNAFRYVPLPRFERVLLALGPGAPTCWAEDSGMAEAIARDPGRFRAAVEEAVSSSLLEGAPTTRPVATEMLRTGRSPRNLGERMILNNYQTMEYLLEVLDEPLTVELVFRLHRLITDGTLDLPESAGRFRFDHERINVSNELDGTVYHVPPPADQLPARMDKLCAFANVDLGADGVHPILRAIVLHFWLAYDHPFVDGNGRTARALFYWSMLRSGYWWAEYISISHLILEAPRKYDRAFLFTESDDNDLTYFIDYHLDLLERSIELLGKSVEECRRRRSQWVASRVEVRGLSPRQLDVLEQLDSDPTSEVTFRSHCLRHGVVHQTARTDLQGLVERGFLERYRSGRQFVFRVREMQ